MKLEKCDKCGTKQLGGLHDGNLCNQCYTPTKNLIQYAAVAEELYSTQELESKVCTHEDHLDGICDKCGWVDKSLIDSETGY